MPTICCCLFMHHACRACSILIGPLPWKSPRKTGLINMSIESLGAVYLASLQYISKNADS